MKLAINGGKPVRTKSFPSQITTGKEEALAVARVMKNGRLSGYRGNWVKEFFGGEEIQALEQEWCNYFNVKHAIPCNSATSGLQIACGAIGLAPRDEVIVSPYSMSCSATAPLVWNAIPVFADIERDYYCLDPESVESKITKRTKAILAVSIFGQPYSSEINRIAKKHNLMVIEDAAQAIGSHIKAEIAHQWYNGIRKRTETELIHYIKQAGTLGDIGVYSFNFGKHITCGEGGMIVTDNDELAMKCRLIMNHAEAVLSGRNQDDVCFDKSLNIGLNNMLGFNMRITELQAAIIREQLKKLDMLIKHRVNNVKYLEDKLADIPAFYPALVRSNCTHTYYVHPFIWDYKTISRDKYINAVKAELTPLKGRESEGVPLGCGYIQPLYRMPIFQEKRLYGGTKYPWYKFTNKTQYHHSQYPNVEAAWQYSLFLHRFHGYPTEEKDLQDVVKAFHKVWENRKEL
jgi:dTDP-4-amino-4,6-dideoxygalactose transaminase